MKAFTLLLLSLLVSFPLFGLRLNTSDSVAGLLWRTEPDPVRQSNPEVGRYVFFCPDANRVRKFDMKRHVRLPGECGGIQPLLKRIVAAPGDFLLIDTGGVSINGVHQKNSRPLVVDGEGQALPAQRLSTTVPAGHVAVLGDTSTSFDSRYFGLIPVSALPGYARRVF